MYSLNSEKKDPSKNLFEKDTTGECKMLSDCGYSDKAIQYYMEKPYMGSLPDADQVSEMIGSCGDTAKIFLKIDQNEIADIRSLAVRARSPLPWLRSISSKVKVSTRPELLMTAMCSISLWIFPQKNTTVYSLR